jgi:hypothetical protein
MQNEHKGNCKYVFVCGLQRSGTGVLARNIGRLEHCTSSKNMGVLQDEGQYLQDVYPADGEYGGTGRFGFDPRAHLTETSALLTAENIARLRSSRHANWEVDKSMCLERRLTTSIMTRFLQPAFPDCCFVVIRRHRVAISLASQKWTMGPLHKLF